MCWSPCACRSWALSPCHGYHSHYDHVYQLCVDTRFISTVTVCQHEAFGGALDIVATVTLHATGASPRFHKVVAAAVGGRRFLTFMQNRRNRPNFATRASPKPPVGRSQILELEGHKAAVGDLNQTAMNCRSRLAALYGYEYVRIKSDWANRRSNVRLVMLFMTASLVKKRNCTCKNWF